MYDKQLGHALFESAAGRYADREGGYTRVLRTMPRAGDNAPMGILEPFACSGSFEPQVVRREKGCRAGRAPVASAHARSVVSPRPRRRDRTGWRLPGLGARTRAHWARKQEGGIVVPTGLVHAPNPSGGGGRGRRAVRSHQRCSLQPG